MMVPFDIDVDIDWNIFYEEVVPKIYYFLNVYCFQYLLLRWSYVIFNFLKICALQYKTLPKSEQSLLARLGLSDKQLIRCFIDRPKSASFDYIEFSKLIEYVN